MRDKSNYKHYENVSITLRLRGCGGQRGVARPLAR